MSRQHEIRIKVNDDELDNIRLNAEILGMQVTPYVRRVALNPHITLFDYSAIRNHTKQLSRIEQSINRLIFTIDLRNDYLPKEIDGIVDYIEKIWKTENELLREVRNQWIKANKQK